MKSKKKASRASLRRAPAPKCRLGASSVVCGINVKDFGLEPIFGAAYMLTDRAFAQIDGDRAGKMTVTLKPKSPAGRAGLRTLARTFERELQTQAVRWAIAKNNLPIREYIAQQAVALANSPAAPQTQSAPAEELTDDQRKEIEKLIAEVESEIQTMNAQSAGADPKNIKSSWEEKQEGGA